MALFPSMGPRRISRGNISATVPCPPASTTFNGAAADQPRKRALGRDGEPARATSMGPRRISRGNDAVVHGHACVRGTSMGPRRISRGHLRCGCWPRACPRYFNGAAADQPRKRARSFRTRTCRAPFNGAAADQPRKPVHLPAGDGHGQPSMGPRRISRGNSTMRSASDSCGSLQWGRGGSAAETSRSRMRACSRRAFNGAAADQPRKRRVWRHVAGAGGLQWGRGGSAAETSVAHSARVCEILLQWGRGGSAAETIQLSQVVETAASFNGAAADQPRKPLAQQASGTGEALQWGRGGSAAET